VKKQRLQARPIFVRVSFVLAALYCLSFALPVDAQVNKCRDSSGKLQYSDVPCQGAGEVLHVVPNDLGPRIPSTMDRQNVDAPKGTTGGDSRSFAFPSPGNSSPGPSLPSMNAPLVTARPPAAMTCPVGSFPWTDQWGNNICRDMAGRTTLIETRVGSCPLGTHPWVDRWGNAVCQQIGGSQQFHDTSKGCPLGTYPWPDSWGNPGCKAF
jgi:hypothetical protein